MKDIVAKNLMLLAKLWEATGLMSSDDIFEDAAQMIREYRTLKDANISTIC